MSLRTIGDQIDTALVARINAINGTAAASSTVNNTSAAGGTTLYVAATTGFYGTSDNKPQRERMIIIGQDTAREECNLVTAVTTNVSLTLSTALTYSHTLAQGDAVKQNWFNYNIDHIRTWSELENGPEAPFPVGGLIMTGEEHVGYEGDFERLSRAYSVMLITATKETDPIDQTNDRIFQRLLADFEKAMMDSPTLGGLIMEYHLGKREPRSNDDVESELIGPPLVGAYIELEVQYRHLRGCLYS